MNQVSYFHLINSFVNRSNWWVLLTRSMQSYKICLRLLTPITLSSTCSRLTPMGLTTHRQTTSFLTELSLLLFSWIRRATVVSLKRLTTPKTTKWATSTLLLTIKHWTSLCAPTLTKSSLPRCKWRLTSPTRTTTPTRTYLQLTNSKNIINLPITRCSSNL